MYFGIFLILAVVVLMVLFLGGMFMLSDETDEQEVRFGMTRNQLRLTAWGIAIGICLVGVVIEIVIMN